MGMIDRIGTFRGPIVESAVTTTKRGFPQLQVKLLADELYVQLKSDMVHFGLEKPGWVDWSGFGESIILYAVMYGDKGETFWFDNFVKLGWEGTDLAALEQIFAPGKQFLFSTAEKKAYTDPGTGKEYPAGIQVNRIDLPDAPPTIALTRLDADKIRELNAKFLKKPAPKPTPAVFAAKPLPSTPKPAAIPAPVLPPPPPVKKVAALAPAPKVGADTTTYPPPPTACTKEEAWAWLMANKGKASDENISQAWMDATEVIAEGKPDDDLTPEQWGQVADRVFVAAISGGF